MAKKLEEEYGTKVLMNVPEVDQVDLSAFSEGKAKETRRFHESIPAYNRTPLVQLRGLGGKLGVKGIFVKNEAERFGMKAFKGLGGTYAMFRILCRELGLDPGKVDFSEFQKADVREKTAKYTFVTATDGNHGKGVSWASGLFGAHAYVYMPKGTVKAREEAVRQAGPAEVTVTDWNYDDTVKYAKKMSEEHGWFLIQDTSWDGYEEIPGWIMDGYLTMASEAAEQTEAAGEIPTHVFLQAGVGSMAGAVAGYLVNHYGEKAPKIMIVEPDVADCIFRSGEAGELCSVDGAPETIMAGLNCGTPCKSIWPVLKSVPAAYVTCKDYAAAHAMRAYAKPAGDDPVIVSGESGASTMGAVLVLLERPELEAARKALGLGADSVILLINTEGDTDPVSYRNIVECGAYPLP